MDAGDWLELDFERQADEQLMRELDDERLGDELELASEREADEQGLRDEGAPSVRDDGAAPTTASLLAEQQAALKARETKLAMRREKIEYDVLLDMAAQAQEEAEAEGRTSWSGGPPEGVKEQGANGIDDDVIPPVAAMQANAEIDSAIAGLTWRAADEPVLTSAERRRRGIPEWVPSQNEVLFEAAKDTGRIAEIRLLLDDQFRSMAAAASEAINMGVLHQAGCEFPRQTTSLLGGARWTITPETAQNPSIRQVADGRGGLMMKCVDCGSTTPLDGPTQKAMTPYARERIAHIPGALISMRAQHIRVSKQALATALEVDRDTLSSWIKAGWVDWPPV